MREENRLLWMDFLKMLAAFLVVMNHSISQEWIRAVSEHTAAAYILNLALVMTRASLPLFFMCSGAGMLQRKRTIKEIYGKSIFRLLRMYVCWMPLYGFVEIYKMAVSGSLTFRTGINALVKSVLFGQYHTWFVATLIALYALVPFLQKITSDGALLKYYLLLSILFTILLPYVGKVAALERLYRVIQDFNMQFVVGYSLYFMCGHFLTNITINRKEKYGVAIAFFASVFLASLISFRMSAVVGPECQSVYTEFSLLGFLIGVSLFLTFRGRFAAVPEKSARLIREVAALGVGIYLLHPLLLPLVSGFAGLWCLVRGVLVYGITFMIVLLVRLTPARVWFLSVKK